MGRRPLLLAPSPAEPGRGKIRRLRSKSPSLARLERGIEGERPVQAAIRLPKFLKTSEVLVRQKAPPAGSLSGKASPGADSSVRSIERATDQPHPLASLRSAFPPLQRGEGAARRVSAEQGVRSVFRRKAPPPGPLPGKAREGEDTASAVEVPLSSSAGEGDLGGEARRGAWSCAPLVRLGRECSAQRRNSYCYAPSSPATPFSGKPSSTSASASAVVTGAAQTKFSHT